MAATAGRERRRAAFRIGVSAEMRAAVLLAAKGFRILARRWKSPAGELDLVARRRSLLVFVEVKARARFEDAVEAVTDHQRRRIVAAAEAWLAAHPPRAISDMRFDVVLVAPGRLPRHLPGAFRADD